MELFNANLVRQIEHYLIDQNLVTDDITQNFMRENNGWIRIELLCRYTTLSNYNCDTILNALQRIHSDIVELSQFKPRCVRLRHQQSEKNDSQDNRTVVVMGLPSNAKYDELCNFFSKFYPIDNVNMVVLPNGFNGNVYVKFSKIQDACAFVQKSESIPINYFVNNLNETSFQHTIKCKLLIDTVKNDSNQRNIIGQRSFSRRLSMNSLETERSVCQSRRNSYSISVKDKIYLQSNASVTEQMLFCQNINVDKNTKAISQEEEKIVYNKCSYEFYRPVCRFNQKRQCLIVSALNPYCFTIQIKEDAIEFDRFQHEINLFYNRINDNSFQLTLKHVYVNFCCICLDAQSTENVQIWNRSQILDFDPLNQTVNLFYVDLGTWEECVPINRIRYITERFQKRCVTSVTCCLANVYPLNNQNNELRWSDEATNHFLTIIHQTDAEIEFLSASSNFCFQTNFYVYNAGQSICVNEYMTRIKQAKFAQSSVNMDDYECSSTQSCKYNIIDNQSTIHCVIDLYRKLGDISQGQTSRSRETSICVSSTPLIWDNCSSLNVKLIDLPLMRNEFNRENLKNQQKLLSIIFIRYRKAIFIPDFNICTWLKMIAPKFDIDTIEDYAYANQYNCTSITEESDYDTFSQLDSVTDIHDRHKIRLYSIDFVISILEHYQFNEEIVYATLENVKSKQHCSNGSFSWFSSDNESENVGEINRFRCEKTHMSNVTQNLSSSFRLPFSNRLIRPT